MTRQEEFKASKGGRPRSVQSQQAILDATLVLFATEGFEGMSIEAIAVRAGVGKKTIYRWWNSKAALVLDAIKNIQQTRNPVIDTGSLRDDFIALFRNTLEAWSGSETRMLFMELVKLMTTHPEIFQAYYSQVLESRLQQAIQVVQRAQERGEIREDLSPTEIISLFAGPIWYHLLFGVSGPSSATDLPERLVDIVLQGIARQKPPEASSGDALAENAQKP